MPIFNLSINFKGMDMWASTFLEPKISTIGIPPFITEPVSRYLFWITPSKGAISLVCSSFTLKNSYCDLAISSSELALSRSWMDICPSDLRSVYLFNICLAKSYLALACLNWAVASRLSNSASICPFFTASPISTFITLIFPGISKARLDCWAN